MNFSPVRTLAAAVLCLALTCAAGPVLASDAEFMATLAPAEQQEFAGWRKAKAHFDRRLDAYWQEVERKRRGRRPKRGTGKLYEPDDYVWSFPPVYKGPELSGSLARRWARYQASLEKAKPPSKKTKRPMPDIDDFLAAARKYYGFVPTRISEAEFKRRYAQEALTLGLTKEQVVRVYALETGGNGTADMQAGINPVSKRGHPISSALGYAQLLHANTIGELVTHGDSFIARLRKMAATTRDPARAAELKGKIEALQTHAESRPHGAQRLVPPRRLRARPARLRHACDQPGR